MPDRRTNPLLLSFPSFRTSKGILIADNLHVGAERGDRRRLHDPWSGLPTVRDVLQFPVVAEGLPEVLAGGEALDTRVRWVNVSESLGVHKPPESGDLVLTTGGNWPTAPAQLSRYIDDLVRVGVSGLFLELVQRFESAPDAVVSACERHGLPLIVVRRDVKFVEVTEAVHRRIISEQTGALRARDQVHKLFTELSLRGSPADFIVRKLSQTLGAPVVLENLSHEVIVLEGEGNTGADIASDWGRKSRAVHRVAQHRATGNEEALFDEWLVVPVEARDACWGYLVALPGKPHPAGRLAVLEQGAIALALGRLADHDGDEWLRVCHQHLLDMLLGRRFADVAGARARVEAAGLPLEGRKLLALIIVDRTSALPAGAIAAIKSAAASIDAFSIAGDVSSANGAATAGHATAGRGGIAVCLSLPRNAAVDDTVIEEFIRAFATAAKVSADNLSVMIGSVEADLPGLLGSVNTANRLFGSMPTPTRAGLDIRRTEDRLLLRLLTVLRDDARVQEFAERMLSPLIEYELIHGGDLFAVLEATLAHPANRTAAAAEAHLSRSAYYERLALITKLLDVNLDDGETLASLEIALLAR